MFHFNPLKVWNQNLVELFQKRTLEIVNINKTVATVLTEAFVHRKTALLKRLLSKKGCPDYFFNPEMK